MSLRTALSVRPRARVRPQARARVGAAVVVTAVLAGCATARPSDKTVAEHQAIAAREHEEAIADAARYDPTVERIEWLNTQGVNAPVPFGPSVPHVVNETQHFAMAAERHERVARKHAAAAADLLLAETDACRSVPDASRPVAPDVGALESVERVPGGVRLTLADETRAPDLAARLQCHLAYGDAFGAGAVASSPLYVRGTRVVDAGDGALVLRVRKSRDRKTLIDVLSHNIAPSAE